MLSILIPEYNCDCTKLVNDLSRQCIRAGIVYEIVVMDDASKLYKTENRSISGMFCCLFVESEQNLGWTKNRNRLIKMARYPYLIMIDSDAEVADDDFINRYIKAIGQAEVIIGSMCYHHLKPSPDRCLRWYYGKKREDRPASVRNKTPYRSLITFNMMIEKEVFLRFPFEEQFKRDYGHEDTIMGYILKKNNIKVLHIDNPLIHNGLELNEVFLAKSLKAAEKYVTYPIFQTDELVEQIKIFSVFKKIQSLGLCRLIALKFRILKNLMLRNLCSKHPSLFLFDFYRLSYLCNFYLNSKKMI